MFGKPHTSNRFQLNPNTPGKRHNPNLLKPNPNLPRNSFALLFAVLGIAVCLFSVVTFSTRVEGKQITQTQAKFAAPAVPATPIPAIVINHTTVNAALIPQSYLTLAAQKNVVFDHHSVGGNMMTGMSTLQSQNSARYSFVSQFAPPSSWFATHHGTGINIGEFQDGENNYPETKIAGFDSTIRGGIGNVVNIAFMKFCFLDIHDEAANGLTTWNSYRTMMTNLIATYPNTRFLWVTDPLEQALSPAYINREKSLFNNALRQYVQTNGGVLYDLADIESHDPNGNLIVDSLGYEALYSGYAQTQDHHLNGVGQQRTASALWWAFARVSGWDGGTAATSTPVAAQTFIPTPTLTYTPTPTRTMTPLPTSTSTTTGTSTPLPLSMLRGHVMWQGRPAQPNALQQLGITLTLKLGATETNYSPQTTDSSGFFTVTVNGLPSGTYTWRVKGPDGMPKTLLTDPPGFLANSGSVLLPGSGTTQQEMGLMKAGDCSNDNTINISDFNILKNAFGRSIGTPGYDNRSDFSGDLTVSITDFNLIKGNFGTSGVPPLSAGMSPNR